MNPLVKKVDHIFVPVADPAPLFTLFTESLGLPVAWPVDDFEMFRSGGVSFGNCNVEFVTSDASPYFEPQLPAAGRGIAFEPADPTTCLQELKARGIGHRPPQTSTAGGFTWTNIYLGGMIGRGAIAFFCEYDEGSPTPTAATGNPLGVTAIDELFISVSDYDKAEPRWRALLAPCDPIEPGRWRLPEGPGLRLTQGTRDAVYGIAVRVRSVDAAREALMARKLLGNSKKHSVGVHYPATYGLDVWFVE